MQMGLFVMATSELAKTLEFFEHQGIITAEEHKGLSELATNVSQISSGGQPHPPSEHLPGSYRSMDPNSLDLYDRWRSLSTSERQVTYLVCMGFKNTQIAVHIGVRAGTVNSILRMVCLKIGVKSKAELRLKFATFDFTQNPP